MSARRFVGDQRLEFPIYLQLGDAFVLYRAAGDTLTQAHVDCLEDAGQGRVWIPRDEEAHYLRQLSRRAESVIDNVLASPEEKVRGCYDVGVSLTETVLRSPESVEAYRAAENVVDRVVELFHWHNYSVAEIRDVLVQYPDLYDHSMQVCMYGILLGHAAGYDRLHELGLALLFHDVGKLDLPREILDSAESLTPHERQIVQRHPTLGTERLRRCGWIHPVVRDVVQNHHERLDGTGYPRRCRGTQLTVATRIAAIVNAFDARTSHRPYRAARPTYDVLQEMITRGSGAYDRALLESFVGLLG